MSFLLTLIGARSRKFREWLAVPKNLDVRIQDECMEARLEHFMLFIVMILHCRVSHVRRPQSSGTLFTSSVKFGCVCRRPKILFSEHAGMQGRHHVGPRPRGVAAVQGLQNRQRHQSLPGGLFQLSKSIFC